MLAVGAILENDAGILNEDAERSRVRDGEGRLAEDLQGSSHASEGPEGCVNRWRLRFVDSHPCRKGRVKDGAPKHVVSEREATACPSTALRCAPLRMTDLREMNEF